ncbi:DUF7284 family protein [Halosimplex amylolyticum]|uniref:DUF7284 family protein n=1 Tax=Halosimplex amylolyticum TaxID=3396616 RepID=UPI003F56A11F
MDVRASSTAFDTVIFVLLVGVAVGVLAGVDARGDVDGNRVAEETADVLATSTAEVTYTRSVTVASSLLGGSESQSVSVTRTARGTHAELLAASAVSTPSLGGTSLFGTGGELRAESRAAAERVLHTREANLQVAVAWRPYPGSTLGSSFVVGDAPPRDADVSVATVTAASGLPNVTSEAQRAARRGGYGGVATAVSRSVVDGLFPESEMRAALYSEGPDRALTAHRYRRTSSVLGVETPGLSHPRGVEPANRKLTRALAKRLHADLRRRFETPEAAARAVRSHQVRLVVRTWSP